MKIALTSIFGAAILLGAGCTGAPQTTSDLRDGYSPDETEVVCYYGDHMIYAGQSYNDGCNDHACQKDGELLSTERACETE